MLKSLLITIFFIFFNFNSSLYSQELNNKIKIGLLVPFSGEYAEVGRSLLYSLQLALKEIDDDKVIIYPKDTGFNDREKLNKKIKELIEEDVKVVIGPLTKTELNEVYKYKNLTFVSLSNINPGIKNNVISMEITLFARNLAKFLHSFQN